MAKQLVWGIPTRVFHWGLVGLVGVSYYTGKFGDFDSIDNHMLAGYGIIGLVIFRVLYGVIGRGHVRFANFVRGPSAIIAYIKNPSDTPGHNPLGALGVLALILSLGVQAGTGLFTTDEIFVEGPLFHLVSQDTSSLLSQIHGINQWVLLGLIGLHVTAIVVHELLLGHRLLLPMITGNRKEVDRSDSNASASEQSPEQSHQLVLAIVCGVIAAAVTWYVVNEL